MDFGLILIFAILAIVVVVILLLTEVITVEDIMEFFKHPVQKTSVAVVQFFKEAKSREERAKWGVKKNYAFWVIYSIPFALSAWFYLITGAVVVLVQVARFMGVKVHYNKQKTETLEVEVPEEVEMRNKYYGMDDIEIGFAKIKEFLVAQKDLIVKYYRQARSKEERAKWDIDQDLIFVMVSSLPLAIFGLVGFKYAILFFMAILIVEKLTETKFVAQEKQLALELEKNMRENALLRDEKGVLESQNEAKTQEIEEHKSAYQRLRGRVLDVAGVTVCKDLKPALKKLAEELETES